MIDYEYLESVINELIDEYNQQLSSGDLLEQMQAEGAIAGLNRLMDIVYESK